MNPLLLSYSAGYMTQIEGTEDIQFSSSVQCNLCQRLPDFFSTVYHVT